MTDAEEKGAISVAAQWLANRWAQLEQRYGRKTALTMAVAMLATMPIPGNIPAVIAAAEAIRGLRSMNKAINKAGLLSTNDEDMTATFVLTTDTVDRDGETVDPSGGEFAEYEKNPVVCFNHDTDDFPIGVSEKIWLDEVDGKPALLGKVRFSKANPKGQIAYEMVKEGTLKGCSVSFLPLDEPTKNANGKNHYSKWKLLEWSVCPIGSNPDAVRMAKRLRSKATSWDVYVDGFYMDYVYAGSKDEAYRKAKPLVDRPEAKIEIRRRDSQIAATPVTYEVWGIKGTNKIVLWKGDTKPSESTLRRLVDVDAYDEVKIVARQNKGKSMKRKFWVNGKKVWVLKSDGPVDDEMKEYLNERGLDDIQIEEKEPEEEEWVENKATPKFKYGDKVHVVPTSPRGGGRPFDAMVIEEYDTTLGMKYLVRDLETGREGEVKESDMTLMKRLMKVIGKTAYVLKADGPIDEDTMKEIGDVEEIKMVDEMPKEEKGPGVVDRNGNPISVQNVVETPDGNAGLVRDIRDNRVTVWDEETRTHTKYKPSELRVIQSRKRLKKGLDDLDDEPEQKATAADESEVQRQMKEALRAIQREYSQPPRSGKDNLHYWYSWPFPSRDEANAAARMMDSRLSAFPLVSLSSDGSSMVLYVSRYEKTLKKKGLGDLDDEPEQKGPAGFRALKRWIKQIEDDAAELEQPMVVAAAEKAIGLLKSCLGKAYKEIADEEESVKKEFEVVDEEGRWFIRDENDEYLHVDGKDEWGSRGQAEAALRRWEAGESKRMKRLSKKDLAIVKEAMEYLEDMAADAPKRLGAGSKYIAMKLKEMVVEPEEKDESLTEGDEQAVEQAIAELKNGEAALASALYKATGRRF